jgi:hypothetical protein
VYLDVESWVVSSDSVADPSVQALDRLQEVLASGRTIVIISEPHHQAIACHVFVFCKCQTDGIGIIVEWGWG